MNTEKIAYTYDGTFEGLLTAVFTAYERREDPYIIAEEHNLQIVFGQRAVVVAADGALAKRVVDGINRNTGEAGYANVWTAFLSCDRDKATKIYRYIRTGMKIGRAVHSHLSHEAVLAIDKMCRYIGNEAHLLKGFARFAKMENGVYYSRIIPNNNVLPVIMPHFAERYSDQPFIIHDPGHGLAGAYDLKNWYLVEADQITLPDLDPGEAEWKKLWKSFYNSIAIPERRNRKLRMSHMPKRYWPNMTEWLV